MDLLKETTEDICEFRLEESEVGKISQFIRSHQKKWILSPEQQGIDSPPVKYAKAKTGNHERAQQMQIDDRHYKFAYAFEVLINTANWLIDKGNLKSSDCPIAVTRGDKRVLINRKPEHPSGREFSAPKELKGGLYIEGNVALKQAIEYSKRLLKKCGCDREMLRVY